MYLVDLLWFHPVMIWLIKQVILQTFTCRKELYSPLRVVFWLQEYPALAAHIYTGSNYSPSLGDPTEFYIVVLWFGEMPSYFCHSKPFL